MKQTIKKLEKELKYIEKLEKRNEELRDKQYLIEDEDAEPLKGKVEEWKRIQKDKNDILKKYRFFNNPAISKACVKAQLELLKEVKKLSKKLSFRNDSWCNDRLLLAEELEVNIEGDD